MEFFCRTIQYQGFQRIIVLQDQNGPCPLIALANILSLRGLITLMPLISQERRTIPQLHLSNAIATFVVANLSSRRNQQSESTERYLHDILESIPKIIRGLDINLKFTDIYSYEATAEGDIFDVCGVAIVHGMVIDEVDTQLVDEVRNSSYNIMIEAVTEGKAPRFAAWIHEQPSMLSWKGLFELNHRLPEDQLYCLFRNNHFSVLTKRNNVLFTLVTDIELARTYPGLPWESLVDCDGSASTFVDCNFGCEPHRRSPPLPPVRVVCAQPVSPAPNDNVPTTRRELENPTPRVTAPRVAPSGQPVPSLPDRRVSRRVRPPANQRRDECCSML